jgi:hypothetical protein
MDPELKRAVASTEKKDLLRVTFENIKYQTVQAAFIGGALFN